MSLEVLLVMAVALGVGGLVKGATGMGLPAVAIPILAIWLGVPHAVALMSLPIVLTNAWQVWRYRAGLAAVDFIPGLIGGGIVGIAIGTWLITSVPERGLSLGLAALVFAYVALRVASPDLTLSRPMGRRLAPAAGLGAGILQGATGIGSPIGATFVHAMRLGREAYVFAVSAMFLLFTIVQISALAFTGVLTTTVAMQGALAILPALAAMPLGNWLGERFSHKAFDRAVLVLLAIVAVQLVLKSLR